MNAPGKIWDINAYLHVEPADTHWDGPRPCVHGKLRVIVHEDRSWAISVERDDQAFNLILRGKAHCSTGRTLNEIFSWFFGIAA